MFPFAYVLHPKKISEVRIVFLKTNIDWGKIKKGKFLKLTIYATETKCDSL